MSYRILAEGRTVSNDTWITNLNNNDIIIGPPGSGKTRGYVLPNILQCSESMVIADTKGALRQQVSGVLERSGYRIHEINLTDCRASTIGYNPLRYIRYDSEREHYREQDILRVAACLVPIETIDPFWDRAARMLLETLLGYLLECQPQEEHTLSSAVLLLSEMGGGLTGRLLDEYAAIAPESFAAVRWKLYRSMTQADRTQACIQGMLAERLSTLTFDGVADLFTRSNQVDFSALGRERIALFLNISDTDRSLDPLAALLYAQALQELCAEADGKPEHRLDIPVRFFLDDFAANVTIPDFDKIISVIRSREISVSIVLQSLSQLDTLPRKERKEIKPMDDQDIGRFVDALKGEEFELLYLVTLFTGMRQGEVLGLTWDCVDFEKGTVTVNKQLQKTTGGVYHLVPTKSDRGRTITPAAFVMEKLHQQQHHQSEWKQQAGSLWNNEYNLVFTDRLGGHLVHRTVFRHFKKIVASLDLPDMRFHDLRHSYAVAAIRSGDDIKTVQSNLGHSDATTTLNIYAHVTEQMNRASADRMQGFIQNTVKTP